MLIETLTRIRMYRLLLVTAVFCYASLVSAQKVTTQKGNTKDSITITNKDSLPTPSKEQDVIYAMSTTIKMLQDEIKENKKQIAILNTTLATKEDSLAILKEFLVRKNTESQKAEEMAATAEKSREKIAHLLSTVDAIVYKQCLLYPLEVKYDSSSVAEAIRTIDAVSNIIQNPSKDFVGYKRTYYDLLTRYQAYSKEILSFLVREGKVLSMTNWQVGVHKGKFQHDMTELSYYKYYSRKDAPPYKSILYLDQVLDKFKKVINLRGNVKDDFNKLIKMLSNK